MRQLHWPAKQGGLFKVPGYPLQFTADQAFGADNTTPLNLDVFAEAADNAPPFGANVVNNLGTLPRTGASIGWNMAPWSVSLSGPAQRTPDLSAVIQEVQSSQLAVRQCAGGDLRGQRRAARGRIVRR
jgi:hypothetical protein